MTRYEPADLIVELDRVLEQERKALTGGELDRLADLVVRKEAVIDRLGSLSPTDRDRIGELREKMTRNQVLLDSALDGIRAVAGRMAELRRVRKGLETYDKDGQRNRVDTGQQPTVERRA